MLLSQHTTHHPHGSTNSSQIHTFIAPPNPLPLWTNALSNSTCYGHQRPPQPPTIQSPSGNIHSTAPTQPTVTATLWTTRRRTNIPSLSPTLTTTQKSSISWTATTLRPHQLRSKPPHVIKQPNPSDKPTKSPPPQPPHSTAQATSAVTTNAARHGAGMALLAHREGPMN